MTSRSDDGGFTLVETLVVISIMGIIAVPLTAAIILGFKTTGSASTRLSQSHDRQQLEIYFPKDVSSVVSAPQVNATGTCFTTGPSVVVLKWQGSIVDSSVPATTILQSYEADYVYIASAGQLVRYLCQAGVQSSFSVANSLSASVAPVATVSGKSVSLTLTDSSGASYLLTATGRT